MSIFLCFLFCLFSVINSSAENNTLCVQLHSGAQILFPLSDEPKIEFDEGDVFISTSQFEFQDIAKYTFVDSLNMPTAIPSVEIEQYSKFYSDYIVLPKGCKSSDVYLYTASGILISCPISNQGNELVMNISSLPSNVYVLYTCNETIKFVKR